MAAAEGDWRQVDLAVCFAGDAASGQDRTPEQPDEQQRRGRVRRWWDGVGARHFYDYSHKVHHLKSITSGVDRAKADSHQRVPATSDFARVLGERLRAARHAAGLSLERLGRRSRVHWSYIGQVERGEVNPSLLVVARLAQALDVDLGRLMSQLPAPPPGKDPDE